MNSENLFSYGTLQYEAVQLATFGRKLQGAADRLTGYRLSSVTINDQAVVAASGEAVHPILVYSGNEDDSVTGMVFAITFAELELSDKYEVADYKRVSVRLCSGINAWVYVSAKT